MNCFCEERLEGRPNIEYVGDDVIKKEYMVGDISKQLQDFNIMNRNNWFNKYI